MLYCGYKVKQSTSQDYVETSSNVYLNNQLYKLVETPKEQFWLKSDDSRIQSMAALTPPAFDQQR